MMLELHAHMLRAQRTKVPLDEQHCAEQDMQAALSLSDAKSCSTHAPLSGTTITHAALSRAWLLTLQLCRGATNVLQVHAPTDAVPRSALAIQSLIHLQH